MFGDWIYYPASIFFLLANLASWMAIFYRLPGHWIIVANSTLATFLLPSRPNGLGIGWFALCLLTALALLGDSFKYAVKRHQLLSRAANTAVQRRVLVGAGLGSLTCVVAGMTVPVVGSLLAVLGAVCGAAGGAWLGAAVSPRQSSDEQQKLELPEPGQPSISKPYESILPRLITGVIMVTIAFYASLF